MNKYTLILAVSICLAGNLKAQEDTIAFAVPAKLSQSVNSPAEESLPILAPDGTMYFARTFHNSNTGGKFAGQDIWSSSTDGNDFAEAKNLNKLNNDRNNVVVGVTRNGKRIYLLNQFQGRKQTAGITRSDYNESASEWGNPEPVNVPGLKVEGDFYSAYVSEKEDYVLWTIPGEGEGAANDLFVSLSNDQGGTWSSPKWLGSTVNTGQSEISPYFDHERKLLFFSSNGMGGQGGYDIFYSRRLDDSWTAWSTPVALESLNSADFDAYFISGKDGTAYFCSSRGDTLANIWVSQLTITSDSDSDEEEEIAEEESLDDQVTKYREEAMPDPVLIIETKDGRKTSDRKLSSLTRDELLDPQTNIRFVYFPYDKYNITEKYIEVMDDAGGLLDKYPDIKVKIDGHTDAVGSQAYNIILSENRAASTKEYLMIHGIEPDRIATEGFGKLEPYATNLTEDGRALNRRVEMRFLLMKK